MKKFCDKFEIRINKNTEEEMILIKYDVMSLMSKAQIILIKQNYNQRISIYNVAENLNKGKTLIKRILRICNVNSFVIKPHASAING